MRPRPRQLAAVGRAAALLAALASVARAQDTTRPAARAELPEPNACLDAIPDSLAHPDTVYIHAAILDTTARGFLPAATALAESVAGEVHALLGGTETGGRRSAAGAGELVPRGEPTVTWRDNLAVNIAVQAYRDGHATWQAVLPDRNLDTVPVALVSRAMRALSLTHAPLITWPGDTNRASVGLVLVLGDNRPRTYRVPVSPGVPLFWIRRPREERPSPLFNPPLRYPADLRQAGISGHVLIEAVIDTSGRAEPASLRDLPARSGPLTAGETQWQYEEFVQAAEEAMREARFRPGRIGGCPVRVRVQQPFNFNSR